MGSNYFTSPLAFLVSTLFTLYILVILLRFLLQLTRADFYNPLSQFIVRITGPVLRPVRRIIPGWGGIDVASLVVMLVLQLISTWLVLLLGDRSATIGALLIIAIAQLVDLVFSVYIWGILIQAILSWVNPGVYNPVTSVLYSLTEPLLRPIRKVLPPIGGFDLSPLVVIIGLQVLRMLVMPLFGYAGTSLFGH